MALDRSTVWPYREGDPDRFFYSRYDHPTGAAAEAALGELEGGRALLFASGSAAVAGLLLALLEPGSRVALAEGAYFGTGVLLRDLTRWGVAVEEFDQTGPPPAADLVWLEAPSNPFLTMPDIAAAAAHPGLVVVDSTAATPVHLRPLEHGADAVVHSATKYLGGHSDLLLGAAVMRSDELYEQVRRWRTSTGAVASADQAWLLLRSLETLELRVTRQTASAQELARRLAEHARVARVRYPGFGGLLSFDVDGDATAVERSVRLIRNETSLGGTRSALESRRRWEGERVPAELLRLSVGLEDPDAVWNDLKTALEAA